MGNLVGTQFGKVAAFKRQLKVIHHFSVDGREMKLWLSMANLSEKFRRLDKSHQ